MRKLRRICAILIVFTLICQSVIAFAGTGKLKRHIGFLADLGIIDSTNIDSLKTDYGITRGDFSIYLARTMGFNGEYTVDNYIFDDVTEKDACFGAVEYLYNRFIIDGAEEKCFKPSSPIMYNEAVKMVIKALGYGPMAETEGGYPGGYLKIARSIGLLSNVGVGPEGIITLGDICVLIYNMLDSPALTFEIGINGEIKYDMDSDIKILKKLFDLTEHKGIVMATTEGSIEGEYSLNEDEIIIDYKRYTCTLQKAKNLLGHEVKYYTKGDEDDENIVAVISDTADEVLELNAEDIDEESTKSQIVYYKEASKTAKVKISNDAYFMYNGRPIYKITDSHVMPEHGTVKLIDNDGDKSYDVIIIWDYKIKVVESASAISNKITFTDGTSFEYDEDKHYIYKNDSKIDISAVASENVMSIAEDLTGTYVKCIVSDTTINGAITSQYSDKDEIVVINDIEYPVTSEMNGILKIGDEGSFYLSHDGYIAYYVKKAEYIYGYMSKVSYDENIGDTGAIYIKLFSEAQELIQYEVTDGITVVHYADGSENSKRYKNMSEAYKVIFANACEDGTYKPQLVRYKISDDNKLAYIALAKKTNESTWDDEVFTKNVDSEELYEQGAVSTAEGNFRSNYAQISNSLQHSVLTDTNTKMFYISGDEDDWRVYTAKSYGENSFPSMKVYDISETGIAKALLVEASEKAADTFSVTRDPIICIGDVTKLLNEEDEVVLKFTGISNKGADYSCYGEEDLESSTKNFTSQDKTLGELKKGDIIQAQVNEKGKILAFQMLYAYGEDTPFAYGVGYDATRNGWDGARDGAVFYGNLYDLSNDTYILNNEQTPTKLVYSYGKMTYGLFDKGANTLTSISKSDLYKGAEVFVYNCPVHGADFIIIYQ